MRVASMIWWHQAAYALRNVRIVGPSVSWILSRKQVVRDSYKAGSLKKFERLKADINIALSIGDNAGISPVIKGYPSWVTALRSILLSRIYLTMVRSVGF